MTNGSKDALHKKRQMKRCALETAVERNKSLAGTVSSRRWIVAVLSRCEKLYRRYVCARFLADVENADGLLRRVYVR